jgi:TetR/AcrR family transcriptional regulator, regulator of biofilm formation and stress response
LDVIAEVGVGRTTHRAIAARAGVPLGATTYYFPTLGDMVAAGLTEANRALDAELKHWADRLGDGTDLPNRITDLLSEYLHDHTRALTECELYLAAARTDTLRPLARSWLHQLRGLLAPLVGNQSAWAIAALIDGITVQHLATGEPFDRDTAKAAVVALTAADRALGPQ